MSRAEAKKRPAIKGKNNGTLHPFVPGKSGNPKGRPKKVVSRLKIIGYHHEEINNLLSQVCAMTTEDVKKVIDHKDATILELALLKMATNFLKSGRGEFLDYIMSKKSSQESSKVQIEVSDKRKELSIEELEKELAARGLPKNLHLSDA